MIKETKKGPSVLDKISAAHMLFLFIPAFIAAVSLRQIQLMYAIEPETGFYAAGHFSVTALAALLIAISVIYLIPALFSAKRKPIYTEHFNGASPVFLSGDYASVILLSALGVAFLLFGGMDAYQALTSPGEIPVDRFVLGILSVLASFSFMVMLNYRDENSSGLKGFLSLMPVLWAAARLIFAFISHTSIANISELLFEILMMISCTLFLLYRSKAIIGMTQLRALACYSYLYLIFTGVSTLSALINRIISGTGSRQLEPGGVRDILLALYVCLIIIKILKYEKSDEFKADW